MRYEPITEKPDTWPQDMWDWYQDLGEKTRRELYEHAEIVDMLKTAISRVSLVTRFEVGPIVHAEFKKAARAAGYKKHLGAKAKWAFRKGLLVRHPNKEEVMVLAKPTKRGLVGEFFQRIHTKRGLHYIFKNTGCGLAIASSHFFDRLITRIKNVQRANRTEAMWTFQELLKQEVYVKIDKVHTNFAQNDIKIHIEEGTCLGRIFPVELDGKEIEICYWQTFISLDMMGRDQLEEHAQAFIDGLDS